MRMSVLMRMGVERLVNDFADRPETASAIGTAAEAFIDAAVRARAGLAIR